MTGPTFQPPQVPYGRQVQQGPRPAPPPWPAPGPAPALGPYAQPLAAPASQPPQRPAVVGMSTTMAVTASMLFMAALGFAWMVAWAGNETLDPTAGPVFHMMERFHLRLAQGLWLPLFGLPAATVVLAFCVLARAAWARVAYSALAALAAGWLVWQWHSQPPGYLIAPLGYIAFCVGLMWIRPVSRWLAWRDPRSGTP